MKLHTGILGLTLASVVALASANAADMYVPGPAGGYKDGPAPVAPWNGSYVGINGGYAWGGNSDVSCGNSCDPAFAPNGWFGGGQIGHNWQGMWHPNLVLGIEADIEGADITGSGTAVLNGSATAHTTLDWFGTVRGRVGYAIGAALIYGTGGFAYGGVQDKLKENTTGATAQNDATATGYAAGGGLEYAFNPAWSAKVEYQYINLGSETLKAGPASAEFDHDYNTVRAGVNYHFLPGYEPLK